MTFTDRIMAKLKAGDSRDEVFTLSAADTVIRRKAEGKRIQLAEL